MIQYLFIILTCMATNKQYWLFLDLYLAIQSIFIGFIEFFFDIFDLFDSYYYINFLLQKFQTYWVYSKYFWLPAKFCLSFSLIILLMANIYHFHQNQLIHLVFLKLLWTIFHFKNFRKFFLTKLQKHENARFYILLHNFCISWGTWTCYTKK